MRALCALAVAFACTGAAAAADLNVASGFFPPEIATLIANVEGTPPSAAIRAKDGALLGYAFSTRDVAGSVGYSGRPLDIVGAVSPDGIILGARIVQHEEPILVIGIPREALAAYVAAFKGYDVRAAAHLKAVPGQPGSAPQAVAGATVTSTVIRDAITRSARAVLRARAPPQATGPRLDRESRRRASWQELIDEGAIKRLYVSRGDYARLAGTRDDEPDKAFIELWLALATPPTVGESLLGQRLYESEIARIGPDDDLVLIAARGLYSFKGTEWRRSGVFDRIEIVQGDKTIRLRATDHLLVERLAAPGAPEPREIGLFRIARTTGFDPTAPFRLDLSLTPSGLTRPVVSLEYRVPESLLIRPPAPAASETNHETTPAQAEPAPDTLWQEIWWKRRYEIAILACMLAVLGAILIFQDAVTARTRFYYRLRTGYLLLTLGFIGFVANAQLSVVNVLTFVHALLSGFRWEFFLLDPLAFILWSFVAVSLLFWGRGVFCGWLCPFGALQELLNQLALRLGVRQIQVPFGLHERLWMIKYVVFLAILAISLNSMMGAFALAEIEPFKTSITLKFVRDIPFVTYAVALLIAGLFIERFFCRYLCPLGAALAIPARMRMFEWLKRYRECGAECQVCARRCTVQSIHPLGQINPNECIYCLRCQANYHDLSVCLHLKKRAERRAPRVVITTPGGSNAR